MQLINNCERYKELYGEEWNNYKAIIGSFILMFSGIIGFIDILQFVEVFLGMVLTAMGARVFLRKGLIYKMLTFVDVKK